MATATAAAAASPARPARAFFTHNWGEKKDKYPNHVICKEINDYLRSQGIPTWFDEEDMPEDQIKKAMSEGIDKSNCLLIAVTKRYIEKINSNDMSDNCLLEFTYAFRTMSNSFVCIVTDKDAMDFSLWKGTFGMTVGDPKAIDLSSSVTGEERVANLNKLVAALRVKMAATTPLLPSDQRAITSQQRRTSLTLMSNEEVAMVELFRVAGMSSPKELARVLVKSGYDTVEKLARLKEADLPALGITLRADQRVLLDDIKPTWTQKDPLSKAVSSAAASLDFKRVVFLTHLARSATESASGLIAIRKLALEAANIAKLVEQGACECVTIALVRFGQQSEQVSEQACRAIWNLAPRNLSSKLKLGQSGACEQVVLAISRHESLPRVALAGLGAMVALAYSDSSNKLKLDAAGAGPVAISALNRYRDTNETVVEHALGALLNLSFHGENVEKLGNQGAGEAVCALLRSSGFGRESEQIAEYACAVLCNLLQHADNKTRLAKANVATIVRTNAAENKYKQLVLAQV